MEVGRPADEHRERIVTAAAEILATSGRDAVSTRAVSAAAGVQAPTIYRLFGDKQGLLDAVATAAFTAYLASKTKPKAEEDPVEALRAGWDQNVEFGLANPGLYALMYGDPRPRPKPPALVTAMEFLVEKVEAVAATGRLRVDVPRAVDLIHAVGMGTTLALLAMPEDARDPALSELAREAVIAAITTDAPARGDAGPVGAAVALRAVLRRTDALTAPEQTLLAEWLDRIARA
ncbi:MAG TPA: TetR/AcrR family transcriptional regulator [Pseudonocardiaceae bacterium]|jgi:AcrR family transcriptional regulator|nr:TetR/AcrR family transcriptional regulator [Pseudonocardiaceae bacterium]